MNPRPMNVFVPYTTSWNQFHCIHARTHGRGGRVSSVGIATRYGLDIPGIESRWGAARFFAPVHTGPWGPLSLLYNGYRSFPGVKRPGPGVDHPPTSKRRGHERVELYLYSPSGPQWPVIGRTFTHVRIGLCYLRHATLSFLGVQ